MTDDSPLLEVSGLTASYGGVIALDNVSMDVRRGEVVAVVGPNGAGKTTLLRSVSGLVVQRRGRITLVGQDIIKWPSYRIARAGFAHVPEGRGMIAGMTVEENLLVAGKHDDRGKAVRGRAEGLFGTFPLLERLRTRRAGLLSGGEQQVLAIARGLMSEPTVLAIDEPSMGLAPVVIRDVMGMLRAATATGTAVLLVEQNLALAGEIANRMYILSQGRIRGEGKPDQLPPDLLNTYLGMEVPPGALPEAGLGAPT